MNKEGLNIIIKECISEIITEETEVLKIKNAVYNELEKHEFRKQGYQPNEYVEYYINGYATIQCNISGIGSDGEVFVQRYYDSERLDAQKQITKKFPIPSENPVEKIIGLCLKLQESIKNNYSVEFSGDNDFDNLEENNNDADVRNDLLSSISDSYKDLNGFRPRFDFSSYSNEQLRTYLNQLHSDISSQIESEKEDELQHNNAVKNAMSPNKWNIGDITGLKEDGNIKMEKISNSERNKIGLEFKKLGLDGNGRFEKKEHGLKAVNTALHTLGFQLDMVSADLIMGDKGSRNFIFRRVNDEGQDIFTEKPEIQNSRIVFTWENLERPNTQSSNNPSRFEILVYAS